MQTLYDGIFIKSISFYFPLFCIYRKFYWNLCKFILYKKAYFHAISNIKSFCLGENTGEAFDVNIKTKGTTNEILDDEDKTLFIKNLSEDNCERQILKYFSENTFCDETMKEACKIFKVNSQYIQNF